MKKTILAVIGGLLVIVGIFYFTNSQPTEQTQEQTVLASTLEISQQYAVLRYRTDNVLMNAEDYADYDAWNAEMNSIITAWGNLETKVLALENISNEMANEKVSLKFVETAKAYTKEEVTNIIDRAPMGKKITTLAKHLGVDVKMAQLILNETQHMISREAYAGEGDVFETCENRATIVKNSSKVTVFVGTIALTGGTAALASSGALAKTAVVVSGADLTLEITADTARMALGDKNKISSIAGDVRKITEPASAILMISTLPNNLVKGIDKLNAVAFGADQLNSAIQSGSIIGISLPKYKGSESTQTMQVSVMEQTELEQWITENGGQTSIVKAREDLERLFIELGLIEAEPEEETKPTLKVDGDWVGSLTYTNFVPPWESAGDDLTCQSSAGLPITVPMSLQVTYYPEGPVYNAVLSIAGGASCNIKPDGWDRFTSVWEKNPADSFTMVGGGPLRLTKKAVSITLPSEFHLSGTLSEDGRTITGNAEQDRSGPGLGGGQLSMSWVVSRP